MNQPKKILSVEYSWYHVGLWIGLIYSTLYIVRPICEFLKAHTPFNALINVGLFLLFVGGIIFFVKKFGTCRYSTYVLLALLAILYVVYFSHIKYPEEKVHFFEYGVLSVLLFRSLRRNYPELISYISAVVLTSLIGLGDEGIQYLLPNRYYQLADVGLNCVSGFLGLVLLFILRRELLLCRTNRT